MNHDGSAKQMIFCI